VRTRAAVFDLGSSSFHLLVCEVDEGGRSLSHVLRRRAVLQLGASLGTGGTIPKERAAAAVAAAKRLRSQLDASGPAAKVVAVGTAALREASNGPDVVKRIERAIGMPVRVLEGAEEARLCLVGQKASVWTGKGPVLGLDLGGGSLEVAMTNGEGLDLAASLPVGAARLRAALGSPDPMKEAQRLEARERTSKIVYQVVPAISAVAGATNRVLLSGGTSRALARLAAARGRTQVTEDGPGVNQVELCREQLEDLAKQLAPMSMNERLALPGMNRRRAAVLPVGATILAATAAVLDIDRYVVSEWGLREGAILDALDRG
jgi:exopolyphosphatase / guanosine-5'-triphosphate,3'-diphosphate pyrophosphatase